MYFPLEATSTYTAISRNATLCNGRRACIDATLKKKITVKRREERGIRMQLIRVLLLTVYNAPLRKSFFCVR
jgi:hypothetical protein